MLQSRCFVWVTRLRHIDVLIHNNKTQLGKELRFKPGEGRKSAVSSDWLVTFEAVVKFPINAHL